MWATNTLEKEWDGHQEERFAHQTQRIVRLRETNTTPRKIRATIKRSMKKLVGDETRRDRRQQKVAHPKKTGPDNSRTVRFTLVLPVGPLHSVHTEVPSDLRMYHHQFGSRTGGHPTLVQSCSSCLTTRQSVQYLIPIWTKRAARRLIMPRSRAALSPEGPTYAGTWCFATTELVAQAHWTSICTLLLETLVASSPHQTVLLGGTLPTAQLLRNFGSWQHQPRARHRRIVMNEPGVQNQVVELRSHFRRSPPPNQAHNW